MAAGDIILSCQDENFVGSYKTLWVIEFDKIDSFTASTADHSFTAVVTDPTNAVFFEIQGIRDTKTYASEDVESAGRSITEKTVEFHIPFMDKAKAHVLECFKECRVVAIVETYDGKAFVLGYDDKLKEDAALEFGVGEIIEATIEGQNGYNVTLTGKSVELAREYSGSFETNSSGTKVFV